MATITFGNRAKGVAFGSMAEGMHDTWRDDGEMETAERYGAMAQAVWDALPAALPGPFTMTLPNELRETAEAVLENCLDNSSGSDPDTDSDDIFPGDVTIA